MVDNKFPKTGNFEIWQHFLESPEFDEIKAKFQSGLIEWFSHNGRDLPWRKTRDPYKILVSELMLQQTQVDRVVDFYHRFIKALPTFADVASAEEELLLELWEGLGYYNRVRNLQKTAKIIQEKYSGVFPQDREDILNLPGIGEYTAGAVMTFALEKRAPIVDTNVNRVISRIFLSTSRIETASQLEKILWLLSESLLPKEKFWDFNQGIMDFGAIQCIPRKPRCNSCFSKSFCNYYQRNSLSRFF